MTRSERLRFWRNLTFWQRLVLECSIWVGVSIIIDVVFRRSLDFVWIIGGFSWGIFFAIVDHAYFARRRVISNSVASKTAPPNKSLDASGGGASRN